MDRKPANQNGAESGSTVSDDPRAAWISRTINTGLKLGGTKVPEELYQKRLEICRACDLVGQVSIDLPLVSIKMEGCLKCGCPLETKPRWLKYWSFASLSFKKSECPHPRGSRWEEVDKLFNLKF